MEDVSYVGLELRVLAFHGDTEDWPTQDHSTPRFYSVACLSTLTKRQLWPEDVAVLEWKALSL